MTAQERGPARDVQDASRTGTKEKPDMIWKQ